MIIVYTLRQENKNKKNTVHNLRNILLGIFQNRNLKDPRSIAVFWTRYRHDITGVRLTRLITVTYLLTHQHALLVVIWALERERERERER